MRCSWCADIPFLLATINWNAKIHLWSGTCDCSKIVPTVTVNCCSQPLHLQRPGRCFLPRSGKPRQPTRNADRSDHPATANLRAIRERRSDRGRSGYRRGTISRRPPKLRPRLPPIDRGCKVYNCQTFDDFRDRLDTSGLITCSATINVENNSRWAIEMWKELQPILYYGGWTLRQSPYQKDFFRKGMTIAVGKDHREPVICAIRLEQLVHEIDYKDPNRRAPEPNFQWLASL